MSLSGKLSHTNWYVDNWGTNPSNAPGTSVTPGTSDAWGSWTTLLSALVNEACCLQVDVRDGNIGGQAKPQVMEVGADPAGGTSFTAIVGAFPMGASGGLNGVGGHHFVLPICIPSGASVGCRIKGANATAGTVGVMAKANGKPSGPHNVLVGAYAEVVGTITFVYRHDVGTVTHGILHRQHDFVNAIRATAHTHLSDETCLEVLLVQGKAVNVLRLADRIRTARGVLFEQTVMTSPDLR